MKPMWSEPVLIEADGIEYVAVLSQWSILLREAPDGCTAPPGYRHAAVNLIRELDDRYKADSWHHLTDTEGTWDAPYWDLPTCRVNPALIDDAIKQAGYDGDREKLWISLPEKFGDLVIITDGTWYAGVCHMRVQ